MDFEKIDEIQIIYNNQKLNMLSYQYDYEFLKNLYLNQTANIIFLINLMVSLFNKKILINILKKKGSHPLVTPPPLKQENKPILNLCLSYTDDNPV